MHAGRTDTFQALADTDNPSPFYDYPTKRTKAASITALYFDDEGQRCCSL
jgi:hypothetical protein